MSSLSSGELRGKGSETLTAAPARIAGRWEWGLLAAVVTGAFLLRVHDLARIFLWLDETDFFNEFIYGPQAKSLLEFARFTKNTTTNTMGWPMLIWTNCRLFGATLPVARAGSVVAGTAFVLLVFILVYRLFPAIKGRFLAAIVASTLAAIAMPQMEFSQRTCPYGATPVAAAALLLLHLEIYRALRERKPLKGLVALYTAAGAFAVFIHPTLDLLLAVSAIFLTVNASRIYFWGGNARRIRFLLVLAAPAAILAFCAFANRKDPKLGNRVYLPEYYHQLSFHSLSASYQTLLKLAGHFYDFGTYHLNLFYDSSLYWPERINWAILPLVAVCFLGWGLAATGKWGAQARQMAWLAVTVISVLVVLSVAGYFPFGGVRQTLMLSPFLFAFTGLSACLLAAHPVTRAIGGVVAVAYLGAWAFYLPRFYSERVSVYTAADILRVWHENGELPLYTRGSEREMDYTMLHHPETPVHVLAPFPKPPYLLVATHWPPLENQTFYRGYSQHLAKEGQHATVVMSKAPFHMDSLQYRTSLYYPPNTFWVYKVTGP